MCVYRERQTERLLYKKPHGNCNLKIYNKYTHTHKKESKYNAKNNHQITGEENKCSCLSFIP